MAKFIINSFGLIVFILLVGCSGKVQNYESNQKEPTIGDWVILQISTDPQGFHPTNTTDAISQELQKYVYQTLLYQNLKDFQLYPYLAKSLPELSRNGGKMVQNLQLRMLNLLLKSLKIPK